MIQADFLSRFTTHLKEALQEALTFAIKHGRFFVEPGDLLVGLLQEKGSIGAEILQKSHVSTECAMEAFAGRPESHKPGDPIAPDLSPAVKRVLEKCILTAHVFEHKYVGTEHLLFALLELKLPDVHAFLESQGLQLELTKEQLLNVLKSTSKFPDMGSTSIDDESEEEPAAVALAAGLAARPSPMKRSKALEFFAR